MTCRQEKSLGLKLNYPADKYCELKKNKDESVELWETWLDIHASGVFSTSNNTLFNITCDVLWHILQFSRNPIFFYLKDISGNVPLTSYLSSKDMIFHRWLIQVPLRENYPYLSFSVPYFLAFGLNTEWYSISIRPKKTPNMVTFHQCCLMKFHLARHGFTTISKSYCMYEQSNENFVLTLCFAWI